jgi:D-sedoheptulose 7-phosphate isomerase
MKPSTKKIINTLLEKIPELKNCSIIESIELITKCYKNNHKLLICGNGGSASDSMHIVGELMKGFELERPLKKEIQLKILKKYPDNAKYFINNLQEALPAISLVSEIALNTAYSNDKSAYLLFAQQVLGYGEKDDILIAISTSGNSKNVIYAAQIASIQEIKVISLTGENGGKLKHFSDININAPSNNTHIIQEYHLAIYHALCAAVENEMFS